MGRYFVTNCTKVPYNCKTFGGIKQDKKFGYIDSLGKIAIPIIYDDAKEFNFGKAEVQLNGETFYINRKGEALLHDSK